MKRQHTFFLMLIAISVTIVNAQTQNSLGVGINSPVGTLHVHSSTPLQDASGFQPMSIDLPSNSYESCIHLTNTNTGTAKNSGFLIDLYNSTLTMQHQSNGNFNIFGSAGKGLTVTVGGNVGIGTVSPTSKLHLHGSARIDSIMAVALRTETGSGAHTLSLGKANSPNLAYGSSYIGFNAIRTGSTWTSKSGNGRNGGAVIWGTLDGDLLFANIASAGSGDQTLGDAQVKNSVNMKLSADGLLQAREVKVSVSASDWPDYVFESGYMVQSLEATEAYIKTNSHLPGVPSAAEVSEQGLSLGEMNRILLQKVEELTLQVIELNKQVKELKGE